MAQNATILSDDWTRCKMNSCFICVLHSFAWRQEHIEIGRRQVKRIQWVIEDLQFHLFQLMQDQFCNTRSWVFVVEIKSFTIYQIGHFFWTAVLRLMSWSQYFSVIILSAGRNSKWIIRLQSYQTGSNIFILCKNRNSSSFCTFPSLFPTPFASKMITKGLFVFIACNKNATFSWCHIK